jgi:hypothetical protein
MQQQTDSLSFDHLKIGPYQSWMEDGALKLYYHGFGKSSGFSCRMEPEEARGLLELLLRHRDDINHALELHERERAAH